MLDSLWLQFLLDSRIPVRSRRGVCQTQLTDTFQEANGLLYADRTPKFPLEAIAAATLGWDIPESSPESVIQC